MTRPFAMPSLSCADCGRRLSWDRRRGRFMHAGRGPVAACDLDSDHAARPNWEELGKVVCRDCGGTTVLHDGRLAHVDGERDGDHPPDVGFPGPTPG